MTQQNIWLHNKQKKTTLKLYSLKLQKIMLDALHYAGQSFIYDTPESTEVVSTSFPHHN